MSIPENTIYPRTGDKQTVYLKNIVTNPNIEVGDYTMYNDFVADPCDFQKNNVLYHYSINHDREILLHCLRRKISVHQCKSCHAIALHLPVSAVL